jgi:hypothetical protein
MKARTPELIGSAMPFSLAKKPAERTLLWISGNPLRSKAAAFIA